MVRAIDPSTLAKHFDPAEAEPRWNERWERDGVHRYDPTRPREETFVVDTPPPTVSGSLHVGHVFCYTHTDVIARYQRMRGQNIFYPMGWDDNGLPTERRVQNYYHVRCDPSTPYEPGLAPGRGEREGPQGAGRAWFRARTSSSCATGLTARGRGGLQGAVASPRALGRLAPRSTEPSTTAARRLAQYSFLDLWEKGRVYSSYAPTMWDVDFQTAVAQAEVEDRDLPGAYHDIEFGVEGGDESFVIATTRPELLPACVGVTAHPDDARYQELFGRSAVTPLFLAPVPIFPSELADPEKGTGILMVCTFGDATDVQWWREQGLALRQVLGRERPPDGHPFRRGRRGWLPEPAARRPPTRLRRARGQARQAGAHRHRGAAAGPERLGDGARRAPARRAESIEHAVKFYEKGDRPLEFCPRASGSCGSSTRRTRCSPRASRSTGTRPSCTPATGTGRRTCPSTGALPPALLRRADPGLVSARRVRGARLREPHRRRGGSAAGRSHRRRAAGLRGRPAREARRLRRRVRHLRHLVHQLAHAADRLPLGARPRAAREALPRRRAPAEPRDHPHLGVLHHRQGAASRGQHPLEARDGVGLGARPRPQEDVEEQGQRGDAGAAAREVQRRRRALLGGQRAPRRGHRLRRGASSRSASAW